MTGEKDATAEMPGCRVASNSDQTVASHKPDEMPGVEEIAELLVSAHASLATPQNTARAILALFAPILAEKEREIDRLYYHRQHWRGRSDYWESRALAQIAAPGAAMEAP